MKTAAIFVAFLALAVAFTWPLAATLDTALDSGGDPLLAVPAFAWMGQNIWTRPWRLFDAPFYHPHRGALRTGLYLYMEGFLFHPIRLACGSPVAAFNILYLLTVAMNGFAMFLLVRRMTRDPLAGIISGMIFAFCPARTAQFHHTSLVTNYWTVLALLCLLRFRDEIAPGGRGRILPFALALLFYLCQWLSDIIAGLYLGAVFFPCAAWALAGAWRSRGAAMTGKMLACTAILLACIGTLFIPVFSAKSETGKQGVSGSLESVQELSSPLSAYIAAPAGNILYGRATSGFCGNSWQVNFYGALAWILAAIGILGAKKRGERGGPVIPLLLLVLCAAILLSLGPAVHLFPGRAVCAGPYSLIYRIFPPARILRNLSALGIVSLFCVSVLAGYGAAAALRFFRTILGARRAVIGPALIFILSMEYASYPPTSEGKPFWLVPKEMPGVYRWLSERGGDGAVIELPMQWEPEEVGGAFGLDTQAMYWALFHGKPVVNGQTAFWYPEYKIISDQMKNFPSRETIDILRLLGVRYVVVHTGRLPRLDWQKEIERRHPEARYDWTETLAGLKTFSGDLALMAQSGADRVYELLPPRGKAPPASAPPGNPLPRGEWAVTASPHGEDARLAIDGREDTAWSSGFQSAGFQFTVDLGGVNEVSGIGMLLRSAGECPKNPRVELSEDGGRWTEADNEGAYLDFVKRLLADPRDRMFRISFPAARARYLRITLTRFDGLSPWSVAELEAYGGNARP